MLHMKLPHVCPTHLLDLARSRGTPARARPARRALAALCVVALATLNGCTLRPLWQQHETQIDSVTLSDAATAGVGGRPFCLHLRHSNQFFVAYSQNLVEAWVTDGRCADKGPERAVDGIRLNWRADLRDSQEGRQCMQTERCTHTEKNVVEGKFFRCATAAARQGNQAAYISTDEARCY
jgi:hypothetical protein